jgi:acyl-CoA thioesterase-1
MPFLRFLTILFIAAQSYAATPVRVLFLGDSLTEGYGLSKEEAYPALVEAGLNKEGVAVQAINGGVSGSTTASGLSRLRWHLKAKPDVLVLALGANDGLRGLPVDSMQKNLSNILELARKERLKVLLVGMKTPPNYGPEYAKKFDRVFQTLAQRYQVAFLPFLLDRIAGESRLNQADGIHPNAEGHRVMAAAVAKALKPLVAAKSS